MEPWGVRLAATKEADRRARRGRLVRESFIFGSGWWTGGLSELSGLLDRLDWWQWEVMMM